MYRYTYLHAYTYVCIRISRVTPEVFKVWLNILKRVPGSVLWLSQSSHAAVLRLQGAAVAAGVEVTRLVCV